MALCTIFLFIYMDLPCVIYPTCTKYSITNHHSLLYLLPEYIKMLLERAVGHSFRSRVKRVKYIYIIGGTVIILVIISLVIFLPPYFEKKQKQRDRSLGCLQYRQMLKESEKSYALNPNGKKWVRESMAAEGLRKDFGCTDINNG